MNRRIFASRTLLFVICCLSATLAPLQRSPVHAQISVATNPPTRPILRIETGGQHTAPINGISVDTAGRYLVTASDDKTCRVWDVTTGTLLRTLRPPLGNGNEGKLYTVAISPDGKTVACAGWVKVGEASHSILLFDRLSGRLMRRLMGLPNVIVRLRFSSDGRVLAAALGGKNGIRQFRLSDGKLVGQDTDYGGDSYGLDYAADGRLVASCLDGYLRVYEAREVTANAGLRRVKMVAAPHGKRPFVIRFSPDGRRLAVGYEDTTHVSLLNGRTLEPLVELDTMRIEGVNLSKVAWSSDGRFLYAGGRAQRQFNGAWRYFLRRWEMEGAGTNTLRKPGKPTDIATADSTIVDLNSLPGGRMVFGAGEPSWGIVSAAGKVERFIGSPIAAYGDNQKDFGVDSDGAGVKFSFTLLGKSPALFQSTRRELSVRTDGSTQLFNLADLTRLPLTSAAGLRITNWEHTTRPLLNGKPLSLAAYEISRSFAISPDQQSFLLGTEWYLRCFGRDGKEKWNSPAPGVCWSVNIASGNGRIGVAAFGDGTIRWFRMRDGKELMAFFPHADRKRWVLWTPTGYYDCSPGGEELIGWHLNRGKDEAADFYPASRFRDVFYRPDILKYVLTTLDEEEAVKLANAERGKASPIANAEAVEKSLPPTVRILAPADYTAHSGQSVTVRYTVRTPVGAPVTDTRALIDGRPPMTRGQDFSKAAPSAPAGADYTEETREMTVPVPDREVEIAVLAENKNAVSAPAVVRVKWEKPALPEAAVFKPKLYVLAVGVGKYANPAVKGLDYPAKDANDFAATAKTLVGGLYRDAEVKILTDANATRDEIVDGLEWIQKNTTSRDVAMVLFAGHGANDSNRVYHFLPHNFDPEKFKRTGVARSDIMATLAVIPGKVFFFFDTCDSGNVMGSSKTRGNEVDITGLLNELASVESGVVVFCASGRFQAALEDPEWGNGAFTKALLEGLRGKAVGTLPGREAKAALDAIIGSGKVTISLLEGYVAERVKELTKGRQSPTTTKPDTIPNLTITILR